MGTGHGKSRSTIVRAWGGEISFSTSNLLGERGSEGAAYRAVRTADGRLLAVKVAHSRRNVASLAWEAWVLGAIPAHPNIIRPVGFTADGDGGATAGTTPPSQVDMRCLAVTPDCRRACLLIELGACDLFSLAEDRTTGKVVARQEGLRVAHQLMQGIAHLHAHGVYHRDLSPNNVLVMPDGTVKLVDFGTALYGTRQVPRSAGTERYMAPEALAWRFGKDSYDPAAADVFNATVAWLEYAYAQPPWCIASYRKDPWFRAYAQAHRAATALSPARFVAVPAVTDPATLGLLHRGLHPEPARRASAAALASSMGDLLEAQEARKEERAEDDEDMAEEEEEEAQDAHNVSFVSARTMCEDGASDVDVDDDDDDDDDDSLSELDDDLVHTYNDDDDDVLEQSVTTVAADATTGRGGHGAGLGAGARATSPAGNSPACLPPATHGDAAAVPNAITSNKTVCAVSVAGGGHAPPPAIVVGVNDVQVDWASCVHSDTSSSDVEDMC